MNYPAVMFAAQLRCGKFDAAALRCAKASGRKRCFRQLPVDQPL